MSTGLLTTQDLPSTALFLGDHRPERTVPRHLVHRSAVSEVLLTDWQRESGNTFALRAQLPRAHSFYETTDGRHDPLLLAEVVRQAGLLISHAELGVPYGHHFLMHDLGLRLEDAPADLLLRLTCHDVRHRAGRLAGMAYRVHLYRSGLPIGVGGARFDCLSPAAYRRLRPTVGQRLPARPPAAPVTPALVGRDRTRDVVLSATGRTRTWELRVDQSHPVLFDHAVDHVPGMLLLEAMRQAAWRTGYPDRLDLRSLRVDFHRFAELDRPCLIHAEPTADRLTMTITQDGAAIASGHVTTGATVR